MPAKRDATTPGIPDKSRGRRHLRCEPARHRGTYLDQKDQPNELSEPCCPTVAGPLRAPSSGQVTNAAIEYSSWKVGRCLERSGWAMSTSTPCVCIRAYASTDFHHALMARSFCLPSCTQSQVGWRALEHEPCSQCANPSPTYARI